MWVNKINVSLDELDFKDLVHWKIIIKVRWNTEINISLKDIWFYIMNKYIMEAWKNLSLNK